MERDLRDHRAARVSRADLPKYALVYLGISLIYWVIGLSLAELYDRRFPGRLIRDLEREV